MFKEIENLNDIIEIIIPAIPIIIYGYIQDSIKNNAKKGKLFFNKWMIGLGVASLIMSLLPLYAYLTDQISGSLTNYISAFLLFVAFGMGAIATFLEYKYTYGNYNNKTIQFHTIWSGSKEYSWNEIEKIVYNHSMQWYVVYTKDGKKMRISSSLTGIHKLSHYHPFNIKISQGKKK